MKKLTNEMNNVSEGKKWNKKYTEEFKTTNKWISLTEIKKGKYREKKKRIEQKEK